MALDDTGTILVLSTMGIPFWSSRDLKETLTPIAMLQGDNALRRTVAGTLVNLTIPAFLKYQVEINGDDDSPPAFDAVWPGTPVTVSCVSYLAFAVGGTAGRTAVDDSLTTSNGFSFYRPILNCLVKNFTQTMSEWEGKTKWSLTLEEV